MATVIDLDRRVDDDNTAETNRNLELKPDGFGGVVWEERYLEQHRQMYEYTDFLCQIGTLECDFIRAIGGGGGTVFNTATFLTSPDIDHHPGTWGLSTGSTTNVGRVFALSGSQTVFHLGVNRTRVGWWIFTGPELSDATNRYVIRAGHSSANVPPPLTLNYGVTFEYIDNENGGRWQAITADGIAETTTDTGITVAGSTWYKLEAETNAAGTISTFFIDGVLVATHTTNIPTGDTYDHFVSAHIMKDGVSVGLLGRAIIVDAVYIMQEVTR
jgi:hypothetical protein